MFVHEQLAIGQIGVELSDVGLGVGDVGCGAEVVGVVVEDVLVCGVGRHIAVTRLHVVGVFGLLPLNGCDNVRGVLRTVIMLSSTMNMGLSS